MAFNERGKPRQHEKSLSAAKERKSAAIYSLVRGESSHISEAFNLFVVGCFSETLGLSLGRSTLLGPKQRLASFMLAGRKGNEWSHTHTALELLKITSRRDGSERGFVVVVVVGLDCPPLVSLLTPKGNIVFIELQLAGKGRTKIKTWPHQAAKNTRKKVQQPFSNFFDLCNKLINCTLFRVATVCHVIGDLTEEREADFTGWLVVVNLSLPWHWCRGCCKV